MGSSEIDAVSQLVDETRFLGAAIADKVLERWSTVLKASTKSMREKAAVWDKRHLLAFEGAPASARCEPTGDVEELEDGLGLSKSSVGRVVESLALTIAEARSCLSATPELYRALAVFGEVQPESEEDSSQLGLLVEMAELLPALEKVQKLLVRVAAVAEHMIRQLIGIHTAAKVKSADGTKEFKGLDTTPLRPAFDMLGEILMIPVVIDGLLLENPWFGQAFKQYCFVVRKVSVEDDGRRMEIEGIPAEAAKEIEARLQEVADLADCDAFKVCCDRIAENMEGIAQGKPAEKFRDQIMSYFRTRLDESKASSGIVSQLQFSSESIVPWVCTFALHITVFEPGKSEAQLVTDIWRIHKRTPIIVLQGRVAWSIAEFLLTLDESVLNEAKGEELENMTEMKAQEARRLDSGDFEAEMRKARTSVQGWLGSLGATSRSLGKGNVNKVFKASQKTLLEGLALAYKIRTSLEEYIVLHVRQEIPMPRVCLASVSLGFQLLKAIEAAPSSPRWAEHSALLPRHLTLKLHSELEEIRQKLADDPKKKKEEIAVKMALDGLYNIIGGATVDRLDWYFDVGALSLCLANQPQLVSNSSGARWREIQLVTNWRHQVEKLCDTSWCYWIREYVPELIGATAAQPRGAAALPRLIRAFADPLIQLVPPHTELGRMFAKDMRLALEEKVIDPTFRAIESDLRQYTFAVMQSSLDKLPVAPSVETLALLKLRPLSVAPEVLIDIKDQVERRLSSEFYNVNAGAPQDAEVYLRMRSLAKERYGLDLVDGRLPSGSLNHSLDVVDIMKHIHLFAAQYSYSLHQQIFTQAANKSDAKIRVITVEHLSNSIRTHGNGVINTTVNYTYGFLKAKLEVVAQFLRDPEIKSRLLSDARWAAQRKTEVKHGESLITWARAMETRSAIRKLGMAPDGMPFLDKLRSVITQIGNSLGYVRMVRNAGMRHVSKSLPFTQVAVQASKGKAKKPPSRRGSDDSRSDLESSSEEEEEEDPNTERTTFAKTAKIAECPKLVTEAAEITDDTMRSVTMCFEASTDYLNLLAQVFADAVGGMRDTPGSPAALFYLLVPSLTLSFIDSVRFSRDALMRRAVAQVSTLKTNAAAFDDGFAIGIGAILRIFSSEREFQSLHWFNAGVTDADADKVAMPGQDEMFGATRQEGSSTLTQRELLQQEFRRLAATVDAAGSLFGSASKPEAEEEEEEGEEDDGVDEDLPDNVGPGGDDDDDVDDDLP